MANTAEPQYRSFFLEEVDSADVFTPEDFGEHHTMLAKTTERFIRNEVVPHVEALEHKDFDLMRRLMREAGGLGLLAADIEERYGGTDLGIVAAQLIVEKAAAGASFGVTLNVHTGIGMMPLALFGDDSLKDKYLPALATGEAIGCYALTEPESGTDALSIRTTAILSPDGQHYTLNGVKQFITNAGFADIIFTYAKVDGDKFTAFLIERGSEGVSTGPEEKKMGIRGTSTCSIFLDNAMVPAENVLFQVGRGHIVAFNILNLGRFKVASGCVGIAKEAIEGSVAYARERTQFGKPVCQFGLMKHKIAEMATRTYMAESMLYRTAGLIDQSLSLVDRTAGDVGAETARSIAEYAIECSMNKVYCSEMLEYVSDEALQMYGGYGYVEDYPAERIYRDHRIFRIYEGTNEINRVIITGWLMRKALKNEIPLSAVAEDVRSRTAEHESLTGDVSGPLAYQLQILARLKGLYVLLCEAVASKYGSTIEDEQDVLGPMSDMAMDLCALDSGMLRAQKCIGSTGDGESHIKINMVKLYAEGVLPRVAGNARQVIGAMEPGETSRMVVDIMKDLAESVPIDGAQVKQDIADAVIESGKYTC